MKIHSRKRSLEVRACALNLRILAFNVQTLSPIPPTFTDIFPHPVGQEPPGNFDNNNLLLVLILKVTIRGAQHPPRLSQEIFFSEVRRGLGGGLLEGFSRPMRGAMRVPQDFPRALSVASSDPVLLTLGTSWRVVCQKRMLQRGVELQ